MTVKTITQVTAEIFSLLEPLSTEERKRAVNAVFMLLGDSVIGGNAGDADQAKNHFAGTGKEESFGPKARQWLSQHRLTREKLEQAFYFQHGKVDIHLSTIVGAGKREQTINCYLLMGARSYLETDNPTISDSEAISLCKHTQAYDKNNHTTNRKALGNYVLGSRQEGFSLTGPGLKAAAELLLQVSGSAAA